jgi:hypothetical protein
MGQDTIPDHDQQDAQPGVVRRGIKILPSRDGQGPAHEEGEKADSPEQTAHALPVPGEAIGQYEIIRELGRGGMGAVFLARDTRLGRRVAIKFLQTTSPRLADRFILEARATARCHHDNIIDIYEVGEHRGNPYMVLEYLRGSPLDRLVGEGRRLPAGRRSSPDRSSADAGHDPGPVDRMILMALGHTGLTMWRNVRDSGRPRMDRWVRWGYLAGSRRMDTSTAREIKPDSSTRSGVCRRLARRYSPPSNRQGSAGMSVWRLAAAR